MKKKLFIILTLLVCATLLSLSLRIGKFADTPTSPQNRDWFALDQAVQSLKEFAKTHNGEHPKLNTPILADGISVEGFLVTASLPEVHLTRYPGGSKIYPFIYFPIDSPMNRGLPLTGVYESDGIRAKILAASLNVFVGADGVSSFRMVEYYYNNSGGPMDEKIFQKLLSHDANDGR